MSGGRPVKHSLSLRGHRTSVSLEADFWDAFRRIAATRGVAINALAAEVDAARAEDVGLASAIRVFILREISAADPGPARAAPHRSPPDMV